VQFRLLRGVAPGGELLGAAQVEHPRVSVAGAIGPRQLVDRFEDPDRAGELAVADATGTWS
jgi:hypothetical protein